MLSPMLSPSFGTGNPYVPIQPDGSILGDGFYWNGHSWMTYGAERSDQDHLDKISPDTISNMNNNIVENICESMHVYTPKMLDLPSENLPIELCVYPQDYSDYYQQYSDSEYAHHGPHIYGQADPWSSAFAQGYYSAPDDGSFQFYRPSPYSPMYDPKLSDKTLLEATQVYEPVSHQASWTS